MERREALIAMNLLPEIGPGRLRALLDCYPDPAEALGAPVASLLRVPRLGEKCAEILHHWESYCNLGDELRRAERGGVFLITCEDGTYPRMLREIHDPPICLYVRGVLESLSRNPCMLAMVGSRMTTNYGLGMAARLASDAARAGWTVVSGLARGIDTACHAAVVEAKGCTLAVLGSGLECVYPAENIPLGRRIIETGGAVLTEFPMAFRPDRRNFPMRNRIISGLCKGTLVVEAGLQSGSLITAAQALDQGRTVFAVPGRVDTPYSRGCHALLKDGARLVESFQDVLDEFSLLPSLNDRRREREETAAAQELLEIEASPLEQRLWEAIGDEPADIDTLVARLEEPPSAVLGALLTLEIKQLIRQLPGKRVERVANRRAILKQQN